ncbi:hypothetical protein M407DRAFT_22462 [Tulasnella calospora MUT 4182]|uniref:Retrotransposon gag domain-containing protein n=1 Tax=Tulasnella calospora MUT 4182 TaxID=1051891 RepID=A0A0C3QLF9_9AGAM|nr:hypothetical protein M407DRAFT_22462 [Tulasnella calospora MUT 4182]
MPPTASGRPIFYGESSKEAEDFIFAIKERAYAEGKQRDNAWIAEFVSICFAKTALRWYEELDEDVQNDWRLLKRAILAEYQEESHPRDETSPQSELPTVQLAALSITPAASPSTNPPTMKGQILVESESASLQGYIGGKRTHNEWCIVTQNIDGAAIFELNIPDRTIRFQDDQSVLASTILLPSPKAAPDQRVSTPSTPKSVFIAEENLDHRFATTPAIEPLAYGDIIFTGGSAEEAEDFIFAIKKRAYSKGKHKDNVWITEFISICFAKKALRWYIRLDPETRNDWELLQRAILDEYEEISIPSSLVPTSASTLQGPVLKTVPAAGPPIRTGRIRVDSAFDQVRGYIAKTFYDHNWCMVTADQNTASIFEFDVSAQTIKFQASAEGLRGPTKRIGTCERALISFWELEGSALTSDKQIYLSPDYQLFSQRYGTTSYRPLALYFETLP